jgi:hypothetical protein
MSVLRVHSSFVTRYTYACVSASLLDRMKLHEPRNYFVNIESKMSQYNMRDSLEIWWDVFQYVGVVGGLEKIRNSLCPQFSARN